MPRGKVVTIQDRVRGEVCSLFYLLLTTCYLLLTTRYSLLTTHYSPLATYFLLLTTYYLLLTTCYLLLATYFLLLVQEQAIQETLLGLSLASDEETRLLALYVLLKAQLCYAHYALRRALFSSCAGGCVPRDLCRGSCAKGRVPRAVCRAAFSSSAKGHVPRAMRRRPCAALISQRDACLAHAGASERATEL